MKRTLTTLAVLGIFVAVNALAGEPHKGAQPPLKVKGGPVQQGQYIQGKLVGPGYEAWRAPQNLTVGAMKKACTDPQSIGNQIAPGSFRLTCTVTRTFWRNESPGTIALGNEGSIAAEAQSSKGNSIGYDRELDVTDDSTSCFTARQYRKTAYPTFQVDCEDMAQVQEEANLVDICGTLIAGQGEAINVRNQQQVNVKTGDPSQGLSWSEPVPTGQVFTNCPGVADPAQQGQQYQYKGKRK